jgi:hypothetical protein
MIVCGWVWVWFVQHAALHDEITDAADTYILSTTDVDYAQLVVQYTEGVGRVAGAAALRYCRVSLA